MGNRRTGDGTVGRFAVSARAAMALLALGLLSGCKAAPQIAGVITGGAVGTATASPALGFAVGIATDTAVNAGQRWWGRSRANGEQDAIAEIAGRLALGEHHAWHIHHIVPIGNEHGELWVVREIPTPWTLCKEIVFSVDDGAGAKLKQHWYTASICHQTQGWKWADAEPAVPRWGYLQ